MFLYKSAANLVFLVNWLHRNLEVFHFAKENLKSKRMTYYKLAKKIGFTESTIKCFMCGANNSRKVAEKIADELGVKLVYCDKKYIPFFKD